jgi:hypothetical protein
MPARGEVLLEITFGPSTSLVLPRAVSYAREHTKQVTEDQPGIWRARFALATDEKTYAHALQLLCMVHGWRATIVQVDGSPEPRQIARQMAECARRWLGTDGRCQERLPPSGYAKCRICPLYDPEWAPESFVRPELVMGPEGPWWDDPILKIPTTCQMSGRSPASCSSHGRC